MSRSAIGALAVLTVATAAANAADTYGAPPPPPPNMVRLPTLHRYHNHRRRLSISTLGTVHMSGPTSDSSAPRMSAVLVRAGSLAAYRAALTGNTAPWYMALKRISICRVPMTDSLTSSSPTQSLERCGGGVGIPSTTSSSTAPPALPMASIRLAAGGFQKAVRIWAGRSVPASSSALLRSDLVQPGRLRLNIFTSACPRESFCPFQRRSTFSQRCCASALITISEPRQAMA
jgi:hypothetical protein